MGTLRSLAGVEEKERKRVIEHDTPERMADVGGLPSFTTCICIDNLSGLYTGRF